MIVIVTKSNCPWCDKAKDLLADYEIFFSEVSVDYNDELRTILKAFGQTTVPQIFFGTTHIGGYTELATYLEQKGSGYGQLGLDL
jgi:glutaredoxin